ncbi:hypothetical protein COW46_04915 [Candidatus Gracilibacteria bacterium CG17_big_fil_post_rev_8_21_14_2_50_48_13]|nr:MAG: hypothetical protein COW46_04915 [Candidatus Gracilibacteria bacterium CG17_big_fil_post_rev_8_21_14_2_50_48_13]
MLSFQTKNGAYTGDIQISPTIVQKRDRYIVVFSLLLQGAFLWYTFSPLLAGPVAGQPQTRILSASGELMYAVGSGLPGVPLTAQEMDELPDYVSKAFIAAEDQHFYAHHGVDFGALIASMGTRGGSTITSQMVKVTYFPREPRTVLQKAREFLLAMSIDSVTSKQEILRTYLNSVSFGRGHIGLRAASRGYFGKAPSMLTLGEAALLAGLLPAPERYSPAVRMDLARSRQSLVLGRMMEEGMITTEEAKEAAEVPLVLAPEETTFRAPHAALYALEEAKKIVPDIAEGGYDIYTTINLTWHDELTGVLARSLETLKDKHVTNGAAVVIEPSTGAIRAMVGSRGYFTENGAFNVALAKRQPGSSLKPFTYLAAFLQGKSPGSIVYDTESTFTTASGDPYIPRNYDLKFHGPVTMRAALGSSLNIPAVKVLDMVGFDAFYSLLKDFGITFDKDASFYGLGITLGGGEVTLTDLTHAYSMLANGGQKTTGHIVDHMEKNGTRVYTTSHDQGPVNTDPHLRASIRMVTDVLRDNAAREISFGLTSRLRITDAVAVKTGTTKDYRDNWAFGYTPAITVGVWVGNNDNTPMEGVTGISGAIPVLHDFLRFRTTETAAKTMRNETWEGLTKVRICTPSGMLATDLCPNTYDEWFLPGTEPKEHDTWHRTVSIDANTGKQADETCPLNVVHKTFIFLPPELSRWGESILLEKAPKETCSGRSTLPLTTSFRITHPKNGDVFLYNKDLPTKSQRIPVHLDGNGYIKTQIELDGETIPLEGALPLSTFIDLTPGEHTLKSSEETLQFYVRTP